MFMYYMYVDILFPLTKAISLSNPNFSQIEHVTKQHQTLKTWIGYNATRYLNFHPLRHVLPFIFSKFNLNRPE